MRHSPYRELTIRRPPCRKTSMHSQDLLSNETAFESDFPARRPFYSLQKLPTYINVTATRNISFPKSGVRARPVLLSFNAEGCKRKLVPLPVRASGRASGSVPTWKYLFREPQEPECGKFLFLIISSLPADPLLPRKAPFFCLSPSDQEEQSSDLYFQRGPYSPPP